MLQGLRTCQEVRHHPEQPLHPDLLKMLSFEEVPPPLGLIHPEGCFDHSSNSSEETTLEETNLKLVTFSQGSVTHLSTAVQDLPLTLGGWTSLLCDRLLSYHL